MRKAEPKETPVERAAALLTLILTVGILCITSTQLLAVRQLSCVETVITPFVVTALKICDCWASVPCVKYKTGNLPVDAAFGVIFFA